MENYSYRIIELKDSMSFGKQNLLKVIEEQELLVSVIEKSDEKEFFEKFVTGVKEDIEKNKSQIPVLEKRIENCNKVIEYCNMYNEAVEMLSYLSEALGLFESSEPEKVNEEITE